MLISGKQILHTSELFAMRSKSLKRMNGFFVSNYDWEVSFKLSLSVIFPMTPTHLSIWSYFFDHNDIDKIFPKAQRPKPMFRNQIWLRTPACLAAYLFLFFIYFFFHLCWQTPTIWKSGKRTKFGWGRRNAWQLSYFLDNYCWKTSINLVRSGAHLGKFQIQPTNNDKKRKKTDWTWQVCKKCEAK